MDDLERQKLKEGINTLNYISPVIWNNQTGHVVGGNQRLQVLYLYMDSLFIR
jgi:hypothetical protein